MSTRQKISSALFNLRLPIAFIVSLLILLSVSSFQAFAKTSDELSNEVFRLHILANSDTTADQALKLSVRDCILSQEKELLSGADNSLSAAMIAQSKLDEIAALAKKEIRRQGYSYDVTAEVVSMYFTTRHYEGFTLPAGKYDALRIVIGEGKGENWWCVLYPPLCLPAAQGTDALEMFSGDELEIIENGGKYKIKFMAVELYQKIKEKIESLIDSTAKVS